jgi:hypothetical protein
VASPPTAWRLNGFREKTYERKVEFYFNKCSWNIGWWLSHPSDKYEFVSWMEYVHGLLFGILGEKRQ